MTKIIINCDGGSRGNPGPAAIGAVLWDIKGKKIAEHREHIGEETNNVAEYQSLIKALELAQEHKADEVEVFMDSELVIRQMTGEYKVKAQHLRPLYEKAQKIASAFKRAEFKSVPRGDKLQAQADMLVNWALDEKA